MARGLLFISFKSFSFIWPQGKRVVQDVKKYADLHWI